MSQRTATGVLAWESYFEGYLIETILVLRENARLRTTFDEVLPLGLAGAAADNIDAVSTLLEVIAFSKY